MICNNLARKKLLQYEVPARSSCNRCILMYQEVDVQYTNNDIVLRIAAGYDKLH